MNAVPQLPFLPAPFLEESFGSWFRRCARSYHTSRYNLMVAVLATVGEVPPEGSIDWDIDPPASLLEALAAQSPLLQSELEHLLIRRGPATLPPAYRDAYCPKCFMEDVAHGVLYTRRHWIDAWTLSCASHGCLLGRFSGYEYALSPREVTSFPYGMAAEDHGERALREKPLVRAVQLPPLIEGGETCPKGYGSAARQWFDPAMLQSIVGRDLLMIAGCDWGEGVWFELFGYLRRWQAQWHNWDRKPLCWPQIQHPIASIDVRIPAAHLAGLIWNCLHESKVSRPYAERVVDAVSRRLNLKWVRQPTLMDRWPRDERERWHTVFRPVQDRVPVQDRLSVRERVPVGQSL